MFDQDLFIRDHLSAVRRMLLGGSRFRDGVVLTGGDVLDAGQKLALAHGVAVSDADLIHLEFDHDDRGTYRLRSLVLMLPRDGVVHLKSDCWLWLSKSGKRTLVLPPAGHLGAFQLEPGELVQVLQRPADEKAGLVRANKRLARYVETAVGAKTSPSINPTLAA